MAQPIRQFKFSGMIAPHDPFHQPTSTALGAAAPDEHYIAPTTIPVNITYPSTQTIGVPQYGPTVVGSAAASYDPAGDCGGNFMSYKNQPNNNCYAYGSNITTNTFPQPGRQSGYLLTANDFKTTLPKLGALVCSYAEKDGLLYAGITINDLLNFKSSRQGTTPPGLLECGSLGGHFVALMVSPAGDANWPGDYHWARCDNSTGACNSWSQKDGGDQVTNFDFAGNPIIEPSLANWTVNQGPAGNGNNDDLSVEYGFYCYMFVPDTGVNII